jgi:hypothetical protein
MDGSGCFLNKTGFSCWTAGPRKLSLEAEKKASVTIINIINIIEHLCLFNTICEQAHFNSTFRDHGQAPTILEHYKSLDNWSEFNY